MFARNWDMHIWNVFTTFFSLPLSGFVLFINKTPISFELVIFVCFAI